MATIGDLILNIRTTGGQNAVSAFNNLRNAMMPLNNIFRNITRAMTGGIVEGIKYNMTMESMAMSFKTLTGSAKQAEKLSKGIENIALESSLSNEALGSAAKTMLGYGINVNDILPNLKMLGDLSNGNTQNFKSLALAFSQTSSATKLTGNEMIQYRNAGLNPLKLISEQTGESMESLTKKMSKGEITVGMVKKAFIGATSEGGRFYNAMENQSKTLSGQIEKFSEYGSKLMGKFAKPFTDMLQISVIPALMDFMERLIEGDSIINSVMESVTGVFNQVGAVISDIFGNMSSEMFDIIVSVGLVGAAIAPLSLAFAGLVSVVGFVGGAIGSVIGVIGSISAPMIIVGGAIAGLIAIFARFLITSEDARSTIGNVFNGIVKSITQAAKFIKNNIGNIKDAIIGLFDALIFGDTTTFTTALKNMVPKELHGKIDSIALVLQDFWLVITKVKDAVVSFVEGAIKTMTPVVNEVIETFKKFDINTIVMSFNELKGSLGPVLKILGVLGAVLVGTLIGAITGVVNALDNFIAGILNAVGVIGSAIGLIWNVLTLNFEGIKESWDSLWSNMEGLLGNAIQLIIDLVGGFVNGFVAFFQGLYDTLVGNSIIPDMVNAIVEWFNNLVSFVTGIVQGFVNIVITLFNALKTGATTVFNAMKAVITTVINVIKTVITTGFNAAKTIVTTVINTIKSVVSTGFNAAKSIISSVINTIKSVISTGFNAAKSIISSVINTIKSVVSSGFNTAKSIISGVINTVKSVIRNGFNSVKSTISSVINTIVSKVNTLKSKFSSAVSGAVSAIKNVAKNMYRAGANLVGNLIDGVTSKIKAFKDKISDLANTAKQFLGFSSPTEKGPGRTAHKWIPNLIDMMTDQLNDGVSAFGKAGSKLTGSLQQSTMSKIQASLDTRGLSNFTSSPTTVNFKIDASHMDVDQLGRMLVSKFRSYGIRAQTE